MTEKSLKPSMRENKRYLLVETEASRKEIEEALLTFLGILGFSKLGFKFMSDKIIAINREEVDKVRAAFAAYGKLIKVKKVSGGISKLKN